MVVYQNIIGLEDSAMGSETFGSSNPGNGENNNFQFHSATAAEILRAATKAEAAFPFYRNKSGAQKAAFLEAIGEQIMAAGDALLDVCHAETALPLARLQSERGRTVNQLKMFADLLREGSWVDARIDTAIPSRSPIPKPDIRSMLQALGPVLVFGASNFPLAFSVAGGDTASALAAGCPVIVKAHPAHPATSGIVGKAIREAAIQQGMPDGVFSMLYDKGISVGLTLAQTPQIKAIGFTGSFKAGKALFDAATSRPVPIPVYAEMGSSNPVFVLPEAAAARGEEIAKNYAASVTLGAGQFCTNPGIFIHQNAGEFNQQVKQAFDRSVGAPMLASYIAEAYEKRVAALQSEKHLSLLSTAAQGEGSNLGTPRLLHTSSEDFLGNPDLQEEIFGPASLVVYASGKDEMISIAKNLHGHLTASVFGSDEELSNYADLLEILKQKVGRLIINGFPTGVEVCSSMVHGGPYPSTTDVRSTSVGTAAIYRFCRPICYQQFPDALLPTELKNKNELNIFRQINGYISQKSLDD